MIGNVHRPKADTAAAMPPWISAAQPSEARAWSNEVGPNPAFPDSYIFSPKWTIFNVRFSYQILSKSRKPPKVEDCKPSPRFLQLSK